jgi:hypothetical protein
MSDYEQTWDVLAEALTEITYERDPLPDWHSQRFQLSRDDEHNYAVLFIFTYNPNSYDTASMRLTRHEFVVPVATYHKAAWTRWVFDRILSIETHETTEFFKVGGKRVYAPHHGNGWDPYTMWYDGHPDEQRKAPGDD